MSEQAYTSGVILTTAEGIEVRHNGPVDIADDDRADDEPFWVDNFNAYAMGSMKPSRFLSAGAPRLMEVGFITLIREPPEEAVRACPEVASLRQEFGATGPVGRIWKSDVDGDRYGTGVGIALYVAAAAFMSRRLNGVIAADRCFPRQGGNTSAAAIRVWRSRRLAETLEVRGFAAYYPQQRAKRA